MPSLQLISYPHPTLRYQSKPITRVDRDLQEMVLQMFEIMYEHRGVGLAANQVNLPFRLFIANPSGNREEGPELVFINPVINRPKGTSEGEEGCLSLPGLNAVVKRNRSLHVNAYDLNGKEIDTEVDGFLARIIQHETDHLDGVLFFDRLPEPSKKIWMEQLDGFEATFETKRKAGLIPTDEQIAAERLELENRYCS